MRVNSFSSLSLVLISVTYFLLPLILYLPHATEAVGTGAGAGDGSGGPVPVIYGPTVRKDERWPLVSSEFGEISAVKISDGRNGSYHLHFITMEPHSLFLPVQLYSQMIFYVNSGRGTLSWMDIKKDEDKLQQLILQSGDIYRLQPDTVFYIENNLVADDRQKLVIYAIFSDSANELQQNIQGVEVYGGVHDMVLGFDDAVLRSALNVPEEVIEQLRAEVRQPLIVEGLPQVCNSMGKFGSRVVSYSGCLETKNNDIFDVTNNNKAYNIHEADHDVENCYGWSTTVTKKQSDALKDTDFSVFVVNLTKGAMMGPHWNPISAEIAIVLRGQGMVQVVCPTISNVTECKNSRFRVAEGDVFLVPKYHPMAQLSFDNESFVFMGFTMTSKNNLPQFLTGKFSILRRLGKTVLGKSFNVRNTTMDQILSAEKGSIIVDCTSCAEYEERVMEEETGRGREGGRGGGGGGGGGRHEGEKEGEIARTGEGREAGRATHGREGGGDEGRHEADMGREGAREGGRGGVSYGLEIR